MNRLKKAALSIALAKSLADRGSWCGETHLQKAMFMLQERFSLATSYEFILYKFGPFSFDYRDELASFQADDLLNLRVESRSYGPRLLPSDEGFQLLGKYESFVSPYQRQISAVADFFGNRGVTSLERIATAYYVRLRFSDEGNEISQLRTFKPHIDRTDASTAFKEIDEFLKVTEGLAAQ